MKSCAISVLFLLVLSVPTGQAASVRISGSIQMASNGEAYGIDGDTILTGTISFADQDPPEDGWVDVTAWSITLGALTFDQDDQILVGAGDASNPRLRFDYGMPSEFVYNADITNEADKILMRFTQDGTFSIEESSEIEDDPITDSFFSANSALAIGSYYSDSFSVAGTYETHSAQVPAPAAIWLLGTGLIGLVGTRLKR